MRRTTARILVEHADQHAFQSRSGPEEQSVALCLREHARFAAALHCLCSVSGSIHTDDHIGIVVAKKVHFLQLPALQNSDHDFVTSRGV